MNAVETIYWRLIDKKRKVALAIRREFDSKWIGELPVIFDGTPEECATYAEKEGFVWKPDDKMLMGGYWDHPTEILTLYPL